MASNTGRIAQHILSKLYRGAENSRLYELTRQLQSSNSTVFATLGIPLRPLSLKLAIQLGILTTLD